ncbi:MAG: hypothetical protein PUB87_04285 [Eubacteriaceae bacterium]|nr:hypothetical protein [Eubacteriaceae bacterium]
MKYLSENGMFCRKIQVKTSNAPPSGFLDIILRIPQIRTGIAYDITRRKLHGFNEVAACLHFLPVKQWNSIAVPEDFGVIPGCHRINPGSNVAQLGFFQHECGKMWRNSAVSNMNAALRGAFQLFPI